MNLITRAPVSDWAGIRTFILSLSVGCRASLRPKSSTTGRPQPRAGLRDSVAVVIYLPGVGGSASSAGSCSDTR